MTEHCHGSYVHGVLLRSFIGQAARLLGTRGGPGGQRERALYAAARVLNTGDAARRGESAPLTPADYAEAVTWLAHQLGGRMQVELAADQIRFTCTTCTFGEGVAPEPSLCYLWWESLRRIAADLFGYGKVVFQTRPATGLPQCDIRLYLRRTAEAEAADGMVPPCAANHAPWPGDETAPSSHETIRQLQTKVRVLEQRTRELETMLEERKLIEKAKGLLMARLKLTEPEAMRKLQQESQTRNKKLAELARIIVEAVEIL